MKIKFYKALFIAFSFLLLCGTSLSGQWTSKTPQSNDTLWILYNQVIDANTVWMGGNQYVYDSTNTLVLGNYVSIYSTADGGTNWNYKKLDVDPSTSPFLTTVTGIDGLNGWASVYQLALGTNIIMKTHDGGNTWNTTATDLYVNPASFLNGISFKDALNGVMFGDPTADTDSTASYFEIYHTTDGGNNWNRIPQSQIPDPLEGEYGISGEYDRIGDKIWFSTFNGRVYKSEDGGLHWQVSTVGSGYTGFLNFVDELNGVCASEDTLYSATALDIKITEDGGLTWQHVESPYKDSTYFWSLTMIPESHYLLTNHAASLQGAPFITLLSKDKGQTWIEIGQGDGLSIAKFINPKVGYAGEGVSLNQDHATKLFKYAGDPLTGLFSADKLNANLQITPNPADKFITLDIKIQNPTDLLVLINNSNGKLLWKEKISNTGEHHVTDIDVSKLSSGIYTVTISNTEGSLTKKFVKN